MSAPVLTALQSAVGVSSASSLLAQHIEGVIEVENSLLVRLTAIVRGPIFEAQCI